MSLGCQRAYRDITRTIRWTALATMEKGRGGASPATCTFPQLFNLPLPPQQTDRGQNSWESARPGLRRPH